MPQTGLADARGKTAHETDPRNLHQIPGHRLLLATVVNEHPAGDVLDEEFPTPILLGSRHNSFDHDGDSLLSAFDWQREHICRRGQNHVGWLGKNRRPRQTPPKYLRHYQSKRKLRADKLCDGLFQTGTTFLARPFYEVHSFPEGIPLLRGMRENPVSAVIRTANTMIPSLHEPRLASRHFISTALTSLTARKTTTEGAHLD